VSAGLNVPVKLSPLILGILALASCETRSAPPRAELSPISAPAAPTPIAPAPAPPASAATYQNSRVPLVIAISGEGFTLYVLGRGPTVIPRRGGELDPKALTAQLLAVKQEHPRWEEAVLGAQETTSYQELLETINTTILAGFPSVKAATTEEMNQLLRSSP
jgi:hypothetical protein